jgi:hypothetical protein
MDAGLQGLAVPQGVQRPRTHPVAELIVTAGSAAGGPAGSPEPDLPRGGRPGEPLPISTQEGITTQPTHLTQRRCPEVVAGARRNPLTSPLALVLGSRSVLGSAGEAVACSSGPGGVSAVWLGWRGPKPAACSVGERTAPWCVSSPASRGGYTRRRHERRTAVSEHPSSEQQSEAHRHQEIGDMTVPLNPRPSSRTWW